MAMRCFNRGMLVAGLALVTRLVFAGEKSESSSILRDAARGEAAGWLSVKDFGAKGDWDEAKRTGADDTAAIQRAIDHAAGKNPKSMVVCLPHGSYRVSSTIRLPNGVRLRGDNGRNTMIDVDRDFTDPCVFNASNGGTSMFHSRIEELFIRVHHNRNVRAVIKADAWQENCGLSHVVITYFTQYALELESPHSGAAMLRVEDCEFFASENAAEDAAGICVHPMGTVGAFMLRLDSSSICGASAKAPLAYGLFMDNDMLIARVVHFENVRHGVYLKGRANAVLDAVNGSSSRTKPSTLVTLDETWKGFLSGRGLLPNGFDVTIRDNRSQTLKHGTIAEILLGAQPR
jgi:hypothetical protein